MDRNDFLVESDRARRRKEKAEYEKFAKLVPDKDWFQTLDHSDKVRIHREYYNSFDSNFWTQMKKIFPGNISERRELVIDKLLK